MPHESTVGHERSLFDLSNPSASLRNRLTAEDVAEKCNNNNNYINVFVIIIMCDFPFMKLFFFKWTLLWSLKDDAIVGQNRRSDRWPYTKKKSKPTKIAPNRRRHWMAAAAGPGVGRSAKPKSPVAFWANRTTWFFHWSVKIRNSRRANFLFEDSPEQKYIIFCRRSFCFFLFFRVRRVNNWVWCNFIEGPPCNNK